MREYLNQLFVAKEHDLDYELWTMLQAKALIYLQRFQRRQPTEQDTTCTAMSQTQKEQVTIKPPVKLSSSGTNSIPFPQLTLENEQVEVL